jgi:WD40 repeat protein
VKEQILYQKRIIVLAISHDERLIVYGNRKIYLAKIDNINDKKLIEGITGVDYVCFSNDDTMIAGISYNNKVCIYNLKSNNATMISLKNKINPIDAIFTRDNKFLIVRGDWQGDKCKSSILAIEINTMNETHYKALPNLYTYCLDFNVEKNTYFVLGHVIPNIYEKDMITPKYPTSVLHEFDDLQNFSAKEYKEFKRNNELDLASYEKYYWKSNTLHATRGNDLYIIDYNSMDIKRTISQPQEDFIGFFQSSNDNKYLASYSILNNRVCLYYLDSMELIAEFQVEGCGGLGFSNHGKYLYVKGEHKTLVYCMENYLPANAITRF